WSGAIASGLSIWASFFGVNGLPRLPFLPLSAHGRPSIAISALTISADAISTATFSANMFATGAPPSLANASRMSASRSASREASPFSVLISVLLDGCTGPAERRGERRPAETAWDEVRAVACKPWGEIANPSQGCQLREIGNVAIFEESQ